MFRGEADWSEIARLRDRLEEGVREIFPAARLNGSPEQRLPNTLNLILPGLRGESLVIALDLSTTACKALAVCSHGQVVATARRPLGTSSPQPGWQGP